MPVGIMKAATVADRSAISWTRSTFNPWIGCIRVSEGCRNCYAERFVETRLQKDEDEKLWGARSTRRRTAASNWKHPRRWNRKALETGERHLVFSGSLCDVFEDHPDANAIRPDLWSLIQSTKALTWQLLTKRPENITRMLPAGWGEGWPHVWLGTSIEDMRVAARADALRAVPARVRFISYEPAIGSIDELDLDGIHWLIAGGESGPNFRPADPAWFRGIRDRCSAAGVAYFYKQGSGPRPGMHELLDGKEHREWPEDVS